MSSSDTDTDTAVDLGIDRVTEPISRRREQVQAATEPLDTSVLKRTGIFTYFGVYALIALDDQFQYVRAGWLAIPPAVRPPPMPPLHEVLGLYKSFGWALTSVAVTLTVVGAMAVVQLRRARRRSPESLQDLGGTHWLDRGRALVTAVTARTRERTVHADEPARDSERAADGDEWPRPTIVDGSLDVPGEPLSLPRGAEPDRPHLRVIDPTSVPDAKRFSLDPVGETTDAEIIGDDAENDEDGGPAGTRPDGGSETHPDPEAPWPPEPNATPEDEFDEDAPWPDEWIAGDEL
ncbi:hypothetical protein [Halorarius litoreus]|uniref:hypothetical protein n=1 Tax=Halorarius litoreus TaxID=2962676 RepID=UPI0020CE558F|nr:hypothetical protein [Halorarius litoreus]